MLFDEKMGETVYLPHGRAYDANVGEEREGNDSAVHVDMILDTSTGRIKFDGEVIQKSGPFVWEQRVRAERRRIRSSLWGDHSSGAAP